MNNLTEEIDKLLASFDLPNPPFTTAMYGAAGDVLNDLARCRAVLEQARDEIERLEAERNTALKEMSEYAREAGFMRGKLEISETVGVLEEWQRTCEKQKEEIERLRPDAEAYQKLLEAAENMGAAKPDFRANMEPIDSWD